ncbi:MAG: hypothetical protein ACJA1W_003936, partial [Akkermansiaceae bacterium]
MLPDVVELYGEFFLYFGIRGITEDAFHFLRVF